jgi:hypothetical protein
MLALPNSPYDAHPLPTTHPHSCHTLTTCPQPTHTPHTLTTCPQPIHRYPGDYTETIREICFKKKPDTDVEVTGSGGGAGPSPTTDGGGTARSSVSSDGEKPQQFKPKPFEAKPGDWICPAEGCGNLNFRRRVNCNKCKLPKPEGTECEIPEPSSDSQQNQSARLSAVRE